MVQTCRKDYNKLLEVIPPESRPAFENMKKIPGRASIITVIACLYILQLERVLWQLLDVPSPERIDAQIEELQQHNEASVNGAFTDLSKPQQKELDSERFGRLNSLLPSDMYGERPSRWWILHYAVEYIEHLKGQRKKLESTSVSDCAEMLGQLESTSTSLSDYPEMLGHLEEYDRPYSPSCPAQSVAVKMETSDIRSFNQDAAEILPKPVWLGCWADYPTRDDAHLSIANEVPARTSYVSVYSGKLYVAIEKQLELERNWAVEQGYPDAAFPGTLTAAIQIINRALGSGTSGLAGAADVMEIVSATAFLQRFTDSVFENHEPLYAMRPSLSGGANEFGISSAIS